MKSTKTIVTSRGIINLNIADETVQVPLDAPEVGVRIITIHKNPKPLFLDYLQGKASGILDRMIGGAENTQVAHDYHDHAPHFIRELAALVPVPFDAIISPKSRREALIEPYRTAIKGRCPDAVDLTDRLSRDGGGLAGEGASAEELAEGLSYTAGGEENGFKRLVVVDDICNAGNTIAALSKLLRKHGVSETCEIILVCPFWREREGEHGTEGING